MLPDFPERAVSTCIAEVTGVHSTYHWGEGCTTHVLLQTPGLSVKREVIPPDAAECSHLHHHAQQLFYVLKGTATFHVGDAISRVVAGDSICIPPATKHYVANRATDALELLVVSQPDTANDRINLE